MTERIEKLLRFHAANPADSFINHALALEYVKLGNEVEAKKYFELNLLGAPDYVATYYHLGKLLERQQQTTEAIAMYQQGMAAAKKAGDNHSYNELQGAYEDLAY